MADHNKVADSAGQHDDYCGVFWYDIDVCLGFLIRTYSDCDCNLKESSDG